MSHTLDELLDRLLAEGRLDAEAATDIRLAHSAITLQQAEECGQTVEQMQALLADARRDFKELQGMFDEALSVAKTATATRDQALDQMHALRTGR